MRAKRLNKRTQKTKPKSKPAGNNEKPYVLFATLEIVQFDVYDCIGFIRKLQGKLTVNLCQPYSMLVCNATLNTLSETFWNRHG